MDTALRRGGDAQAWTRESVAPFPARSCKPKPDRFVPTRKREFLREHGSEKSILKATKGTHAAARLDREIIQA